MDKKMYILAQAGPLGSILLGVFSNIANLNLAIRAIKINNPNLSKVYYHEIEVDNFDSTCLQFFTMHPERLTEVNVEEDKLTYV